MEDNKTRVLYDRLTQDGYDIGDFDSFSKNVQDKAKRKSLYETITNDGYDVGDFDSFSSKLVARSQEEPVTNVTTRNVQPQVQPVQDMPSYDPKTQGYILDNVPDMFRSKGNNLATRPLPQQDLFENNPSDLVRKIGIDQQQRVEKYNENASRIDLKSQIDKITQDVDSQIRKRGEKLRNENKSSWWMDIPRGSGGAISTIRSSSNNGRLSDETYRQLNAAKSLVDDSRKIIQEATREDKGNVMSQLGRGLKDYTFDVDTWSQGVTKIAKDMDVKSVLDKADNGEELTKAEQSLLDAFVTNMAVNAYYGQNLGSFYKAGRTTAESIPFMLEFAINPISSTGNKMAKSILKYGLKKFGKAAGSKAAKVAARLAADTAAAAGMTVTTGAVRTIDDAVNRMSGDVKYNMDNGSLKYSGRENQKSFGQAIGKAAVMNTLENQSEMIFNAFRGTGEILQKALPGGVKSFLSGIAKSKPGQIFNEIANNPTLKELAAKTQFHGIGEEYLEEVYNNMVSVPLGEMSFEQATDLDQNIDTFLGLLPTSLAFGMIGAGGYASEKFRNYRDRSQFEKMMEESGEDWSGVREALQDADIETARNMVKDVLSSPMSPDMKKNAIKYISSVLQEQTLQEADKQMMPEEIAFEKKNIINNLNETRSKISLNDEELNSIINSEEGYQAIISQFDPETANNIMKYKQAYDDFVNYNYWVQDQADNARRQAEAQVESLTNATTGTIMRVNSGLSTNPVNILRGNLVFDNEGKVDENQSDKTIYYMSEDGRVKMAPVSMFSSLVDNTPAEEMIQRAGNDAQEEVLQAEEAQINSIPAQEQQPIEPETRFTMGGNNYEVNRVTPDGYEVYLLDENGTPAQSQLMSEEEIRNAINGQQPANAEETQPSVTEQTVQEETSEQPVQENQTAMSRIPLNERGEQDFEAAPVADTSAALLEISDNVDDAKDTATQMIDHYNNELKKAEKAKSTGNTIQEIVKMKQEKKANIKAINDKISYWNQVAADLEAKRPTGLIAQAEEKAKENQQRLASMTAEEQQAAQQEVQKKIDAGAFERKEPRKKVRYVKEDADLGPSITPQEHVLREIATGRVSFSLSDTEGAQGLSSHLGYSNSPEERKKLVWALSSDGLTPEAAAEQIHADMPENLQGMVTDQDVFNMIINAFQEYGSPSKMWDAAKNMHGTDIEENIPGYEEDQERQLIEWEASENRMSVSEWIAYSDYIEEELNNLYSSVTDEELNTIFEQIYNDYERRTETESAGSTEGQTDSKQGNELLSESRSDNEGTDATGNEQPQSANQTDGKGGSVVSEPGSEVIREKETYDGALNNGNNSVYSQNNLNGREHEQGEVAGVSGESGSLDGKNEAEAYLRRAGDRTTAEDGQSRWTRNTLLRDVVQRNKGHQTWIDDIQSIISGERIGLGGENDVYLSRDGKSVIKINDFSYLPENSTNFDSFMNRVDAHNELFPHDAITILGFTLNSDSKVSVVLSQPYIGNAREATQEEIDNFLEEMGFYTDMSGNWTDGTYEIADTKPNNVLVDEYGNLHFIDVLPYDSRKPGKMLEIPAKRNDFVAPDIKNGEDMLDYIHRVAKAKEINDAERETDINPTEGQKEAGNYKKGHVKIDGYDVTIENPKGSVRSGKDANGKEWSVTMNNTYGYIRGTRGVDGDHIDIFLSDNPESGNVYVIDQVDQQTGMYDESKVMYGFNSIDEAKDAYLSNYEEGWKVGVISEVSKDEFKKWIESSTNKIKPFSEYKNVDVISAENDGSAKDIQPANEDPNNDESNKKAKLENSEDVRFREEDIVKISGGRKIKFTRKNPTNTFNALVKYLESEDIKINDISKAKTGSKYVSFEINGVSYDVRAANHTKGYYGEHENSTGVTVYWIDNVNGIDIDLSENEMGIDDIKQLIIDVERFNSNENISYYSFIAEKKNPHDFIGENSVLANQMLKDMLYDLKKEKENLSDNNTEEIEKINNLISQASQNVLFRFIGEQGAANLDAAEEANTRLDNLAVAREMEKSGKDAKSIKIATGWERGADNKWRYEEEDFEYIPKGNAREKSLLEREPWHKELMSLSDKVYNGEKLSNEEEVRFDELSKKETELKDSLKKSDIKFLDDYVSDNTLFKEYPELKQVKVEFYDGSFFDGGSYSHHDMTIRINNNSPLDAKSILVHEVQHAIQHIEGFSRGGNSRTYRNYLNSIKEKRDAWSMVDEFEEKSKELGSDASQMDVYKAVRDEYTSLGMTFGDGIMPSRDAFDKGFNLWARGYDKEGYEDAYKEYQNLIEKFGLGESKDRYHELSGEVEARNVQSRLNMTPEERRNTLASETEDVAREDQIFLYDSMGVNSMTIDENQDLNNIKSEDVEETSKKLNVPVEVITSVDQIKDNSVRSAIEKGRKVKGWYSLSDNKVYVYLPNATSMEDVNQTILHEGVAHYGLRQLVGEERMDDFLDDVFANVTDEVRKKIIDTLPRYGYNSRIATEEYMAIMAENGVDVSVWQRIKQAFNSLMRRMGINIKISDNELRYILWRSRQNLDKNKPLDLAKDVAMQYQMGVGNYFREVDQTPEQSIIDAWDNIASSTMFSLRESTVDYLTAIDKFQDLISKRTGEEIKSFENAYDSMTFLSSKNRVEMDWYDSNIVTPMRKAILELVGKQKGRKWDWNKGELRKLVMYVEAKHGAERNRQMAIEKYIKELKPESLKFFENAGISIDRDKYKEDLKKAKEEAGKKAYDKSFQSIYDKLINEGLQKEEAESQAKKRAKVIADRAESNASEKFRNDFRDKLMKEYSEKVMSDWNDTKKRISKQKDISWIEKQRELDREASRIGADLSQDYSGLSSVFGDEKEYPDGWYESSLNFVEEYENNHNETSIGDLWKSISQATDYTLNKQYESGLVSKEYVDRQKQRFENYIPLRGFQDEIAGDVYNYIENDFYPGSNPVKSAKGRTSEAGNPFGSILNTGYSTISVGNKNLAKMSLYSLVNNHDTEGLAVSNRAWMVKYDKLMQDDDLMEALVIPSIEAGEDIPEWVEAVPKYPEGDISSEEVSRILGRFEDLMKKNSKEGYAKPISKRSRIAYRTLYKERSEHEIPLYILGDKYVITITGNPRVAQAMNGLLNPNVNNKGWAEIGERMQRFMAGAFTAKNAAFSIANLTKDSMYANNQVFIKENIPYWIKFTKKQKAGFGDFIPMMMRLKKYRDGNLDLSDETNKMFKEFMDNGGATGYTFVDTQEKYAKELADKLKELSKSKFKVADPRKLITAFFDSVEFTGQAAELVNRFAAYQTSRDMGRSVTRSIRDAKEITVNFNRKGAGMKSWDDKKSLFDVTNMAAFFSQYGRAYILFWNANMQAKYRFYKNIKEHPIKTSTTLIGNSMMFASVLVPFMNNFVLPALYEMFGIGSGDDDEDYYNTLTDWERTHNICIRLPYGNWLKIPLSPEMSPWYTIGDCIGGAIAGQRELSASDFIKSGIDAISPLSINWSYEGANVILNVLPTISQPVAQVAMNVNFMGNPIKKQPFTMRQGFAPQYTMVYGNTSPALIELSRLSNKLTGGTDSKTSGPLDWNPALWQNVITGYTGGYGSSFLSAADWIVSTSKGEEQSSTIGKIPLVSRFFISGNKDVKIRRINSSFYDVIKFTEEFKFDQKSLENQMNNSLKEGNKEEYMKSKKQLEELLKSDRAKKYIQLDNIVDSTKDFEKYLKEMPDDETTQGMLYQLKSKGLEILKK